MKYKYTTVDLALLAVVAAVFGAVFTLAWTPYYAVKAIGGKLAAVLLTYGIWYMAAPLAASLIRKPGAAFFGETLAGLVESLLPQVGGFSCFIYGLGQGIFSEIAYAVFRYRKYGALQATLAGALPAIPSLLLDILLWQSVYPPVVFAILLVLAAASGAIYGVLGYLIVSKVSPRR
ncbi:MAG TPA: ABC transporter permease [Thermoprotei archaeon]|nr:ABC transporter permease [Thermoprotei archaeon]